MSTVLPGAVEYPLQQNFVANYPPTVRIVRHLVSFLQWRFSLLPIGAYHWAPEDETSAEGVTASEIYISGDTPLPGRAVGERPAITILRSQLGFQGVGIGDMLHHDWQSGGKQYLDLLPTTIVINVLSRLAFVAERLAWFVQEQVFCLREELVRNEPCLLSMGARTTMAPPSPAGALVESAESDWMVVALYLPVYLQHRAGFVPINVPVVDAVDVTTEVK